MIYHRVCNKRNTTGVTRGAGNVYPFGTYAFTPVLVGFVLLDFSVFCVVFCRSFFLLFLLTIVLTTLLLRFTASG